MKREYRNAAVGRIVRYLAITAAVYLMMALLGRAAAAWLTGMGLYAGKIPWSLRSVCASLTTILLVLLHRRFTFRVHAAVAPVLLTLFVGSSLWSHVTDTIVDGLAGVSAAGANVLGVMLAAIWLVISYLLQRFTFYGKALQEGEEHA